MPFWRRKPEAFDWRDAALFAGLDARERRLVERLALERTVEKDDVLLHEGEPGRSVYLVLRGTMEIFKRGPRGADHRLGLALPGDFFGEAALFEDLPRAASVRALEPSLVLEIPLAAMHQRALSSRGEPQAANAYQKLVLNTASALVSRLRGQTDRVIETAHEREVMGRFLVQVLVLLCAYVFFVAGLTQYASGGPANTSYVSIPLQLLFGLGAWGFIRSTGYPLARFGISFRHIFTSVIEALFFTAPVLVFLTGIKWVAIATGLSPPAPVVAHPEILARLREPEILPLLIVYALSSAVQELIVRGALQSSLSMFLVGPHRVRNAILVSALLFAVMHLHMAFLFAAIAFLPGIYWGWLFARRPNLAGVTLSHILVGGYVFFILGVQL